MHSQTDRTKIDDKFEWHARLALSPYLAVLALRAPLSNQAFVLQPPSRVCPSASLVVFFIYPFAARHRTFFPRASFPVRFPDLVELHFILPEFRAARSKLR